MLPMQMRMTQISYTEYTEIDNLSFYISDIIKPQFVTIQHEKNKLM